MNAINKKQDITCVDNERHTYTKRQSLSKETVNSTSKLAWKSSVSAAGRQMVVPSVNLDESHSPAILSSFT
jgi:hypothetical protein